jgi:hypothetical protein
MGFVLRSVVGLNDGAKNITALVGFDGCIVLFGKPIHEEKDHEFP